MRRNTEDKTLERNYVQKWRHMIAEYELVKAKKHHCFLLCVRFLFVSWNESPNVCEVL
jgi:hypothetical protein